MSIDFSKVDANTFYLLDDSEKMGYVLHRLRDAKMMYKIINDSFVMLPQSEIKELESLGDAFVSVGILAEDCDFQGLYEQLQGALDRLEQISSKVYYSSYS